MEQKFAMVQLEHGTHKTDLSFLSRPVEEKVKAYHQSFPVYQERLGNWEWEKYM